MARGNRYENTKLAQKYLDVRFERKLIQAVRPVSRDKPAETSGTSGQRDGKTGR